jgi:hypothetical protein
MKLLRSFEEFTFEAVSWVVFYPLTLWRILTRPLRMMAYSDAEQQKNPDARYDESLSPLVLLLITIFAVHGIEAALNLEAKAPSLAVQSLLSSPQTLALFRAIAFSLIPLAAAVILLRRTGVKLSRDSLRPPFFAQCYLATPCCLAAGAGFVVMQRPDVLNAIGASLVVAAGAWFVFTQTRWFRQRLGVGWFSAAATTVWALVCALGCVVVLAAPLTLL